MPASSKVYIEKGSKRVFAGALDWPGWCRGGSDEDAALDALIAYGPRYARAMRAVKPAFRPPRSPSALTVVERLKGDATTDFGAPSIAPAADARKIDSLELVRLQALLKATWRALDRAADQAAGVTLRKGPRGGGRDLDAILNHVAGAETAYVRRLAAKPPNLDEDHAAAAAKEIRRAVLDALTSAVTEGLPKEGPRGGRIWLPRYFVRRTAWHALDHAWEIEDRSTP
ncbi:MAG TPA: hypothetical protein VGR41_04585 [Actinomycetota bacterium]|jgi:hypothetical protein|nr:hypothetical protein [Actinomycetota bacterium]